MESKGSWRSLHSLELRAARRIVPFVRETRQIFAQSYHETDGVRVPAASGRASYHGQSQQVL